MKRILVLSFILTFTIGKNMAQNYLTSEIITKVINIKIGQATGSSFLINHNKNNYLVTAKHVLGNVHDKQKLNFEFYQDSLWKKATGTVLLHANSTIDIAVIDLHDKTKRKNHVELTTTNIIYGDEGYFLGFPYGLKIEDASGLNSGLPLPLVKKAVLSAIFNHDGITTLFLDGHNNPGFSGGPIIFKNTNNTKKYKWNIIGVVSGYKSQNNEARTPFGKFSYHENSGIMVGYGINHVMEIIKQNKI